MYFLIKNHSSTCSSSPHYLIDSLTSTSEKPVLLDFWADWCQPCLNLVPTLENLADTYKNKVLFAKLNVDENPKISMEFGIRSIPYMFLIKDGDIKDFLVGNQSKEKINLFLEKNLEYA